LGLFILITALSLSPRPAFGAEESGRKVKSRVAPQYPDLAKRMKISGTVKVEVVISPTGIVKSTRVIGGHPLLVESSIDAVKRWKYEPASGETTETVEFKFNDNND
jgi:TonB family protein